MNKRWVMKGLMAVVAVAAMAGGCANRSAAVETGAEGEVEYEWEVIALDSEVRSDTRATQARAILLNKRTGETWVIMPGDVQSWWRKMERKK